MVIKRNLFKANFPPKMKSYIFNLKTVGFSRSFQTVSPPPPDQSSERRTVVSPLSPGPCSLEAGGLQGKALHVWSSVASTKGGMQNGGMCLL